MSGGPLGFLSTLFGPGPAPGNPATGVQSYGGLGGLGGLGGSAPQQPGMDFGDILGAIGESLLTSNDRRTPLAGLPTALQRRSTEKQKSHKDQQDFQARKAVLMQMGKTEAEAETMARSGDAVDLWIKGEQMRRQQDYQNRVLAQGSSTSDIREFEYAKKSGYTGSFEEWQTKKAASAGGGGFGLTPAYGVDANGNPVALQFGRDGKAVASQLPDGVRLSKEPIKFDAGTHFVLLDPVTRQQIGTVPKDLAGAAQQQAIGKGRGEAIAGAPGQYDAASDALNVVNQIKNHPNRQWATGFGSNFPTFKGGKTADFEGLVEQAKSGAFLTAVQQLRGLGAMSEYEAKAATAAINRMNIETSDAGFLKAVQDYEAIVRRAQEKAARLMQQGNPGAGGVPQGQGTAGRTRSGVSWSAQ